MRKSIGCLSIPGAFSALITLLLIAAAVALKGGSLFSAGALNAESGEEILGGVSSHHEIGGECKTCHTAPWEAQTMADRCMVCHTEVLTELNSNSGLHGEFLQKQLSPIGFQLRINRNSGLLSVPSQSLSLRCLTCHHEHRGEEAPLVEMALADFPHDELKFSLRSHQYDADTQPFTCADCHEGKYTTPLDTTTCVNCHFSMEPQFTQAHALQFGLDCINCHDGLETLGSNFDHGQFPFQLTGQHAQADCADCHPAVRTLIDFQSTPQNCFSCHQQDDQHIGQLGENCEACHTPAGWDQVKVDHSLFTFKLTGAHVNVACESCHQNNVYKGTPQDCASCHQNNDPHEGRFGTDCASCHTTDAWKPAKFDHNLAAFKLTGSHISVTCESCHQNGVYKGTSQDCYACHAKDDKHNGQFGVNCESCHTTSAWKDAAFDHNLSAFKLTGSHVNTVCTGCHINGVFKGTPQDCYSCHRGKDKHNGLYGTNCAACHTTSAWTGATFNHNLSNFPLTGAHVNQACTRCHVNGQYSGLSSACVSCHDEPAYHAGIFGTNCAGCHGTSNWSATYAGQHPSIADEGGSGVNHGHTSCRTCHTTSFSSATCTACHDGNEGGEGGGDDHEGGDD
jgi:hypothetical protein